MTRLGADTKCSKSRHESFIFKVKLLCPALLELGPRMFNQQLPLCVHHCAAKLCVCSVLVEALLTKFKKSYRLPSLSMAPHVLLELAVASSQLVSLLQHEGVQRMPPNLRGRRLDIAKLQLLNDEN